MMNFVSFRKFSEWELSFYDSPFMVHHRYWHANTCLTININRYGYAHTHNSYSFNILLNRHARVSCLISFLKIILLFLSFSLIITSHYSNCLTVTLFLISFFYHSLFSLFLILLSMSSFILNEPLIPAYSNRCPFMAHPYNVYRGHKHTRTRLCYISMGKGHIHRLPVWPHNKNQVREEDELKTKLLSKLL